MQANTLSASEKFRIETFYVIVDKLVTELQYRSQAYERMTTLFGFLLHLLTINDNDLQNQANELVEVYSDDLDNNLYFELKQFISLLRIQKRVISPIGLQKLKENLMKN